MAYYSLWSKFHERFPKMPHKGGGGGGDKAAQFWDAIRSQNQKTLHWCLNYGGISSATRDDDGFTGLHHAAMHGKVRSLETILDHIRRIVLSRGGGDIRGTAKNKKTAEEIDEKDDENGMTAFMHACAGGHYECVKLLHVSYLYQASSLIYDAHLKRSGGRLCAGMRSFVDLEERCKANGT